MTVTTVQALGGSVKKKYEDEILEKFTTAPSKNFPFCEAPKRCVRKKDFEVEFLRLGEKIEHLKMLSTWSKFDEMALTLHEEIFGTADFPSKLICDVVRSVLAFQERMLNIKSN